MAVTDDLAKIAVQEKKLVLPLMDNEVAWRIGMRLRELALSRNHPVVIDVRRFGQLLFYNALAGGTPNNTEWIRRKQNVVARFLRSSYAVGLEMRHQKTTLAERHGVSASEYAANGGCFPLTVASAGIVGMATISGLTEREDHELVVEALCLETGQEYSSLRLPPEG